MVRSRRHCGARICRTGRYVKVPSVMQLPQLWLQSQTLGEASILESYGAEAMVGHRCGRSICWGLAACGQPLTASGPQQGLLFSLYLEPTLEGLAQRLMWALQAAVDASDALLNRSGLSFAQTTHRMSSGMARQRLHDP